jgi:NAD(P)-dependent dehydrogenase (short-subunit alcohol dehydrogenase family)
MEKKQMSLLERFRVDGRVAVVTGASSGLGVSFAVALADAGADVVLAARRTERLDETAEQVRALGRRAVVVQMDVSRPEDCNRVVDTALDELGAVNILVNNAGLGTAHPAVRETPQQFTEVIDVNLNGCYWMAQACGRVMPPGSSIINVSSVLATTTAGLPQAAYTASKSGLLGLTRDLAQQWSGRRQIRVNALQPGYFQTEMTAQYAEAYVEKVLERVPIGRYGQAEELAAAMLFLASDASSFVTGVSLPVDGGFLLT